MPSGDFSITSEWRGSEAIFTIKGRLYTSNADELQTRLDNALERGATHVSVNMRHVSFLSSSGIRVLLAVYKEARKRGGKLVVASPSENVRNVLGMTALKQLMGED